MPAQRLRFQADGEVQIKGEEGILLTADGKFDEAMFDRVFGEYRSDTLSFFSLSQCEYISRSCERRFVMTNYFCSPMFEELLDKQESLMHQIKMLQKQVENTFRGGVQSLHGYIA